MPLVNKVLESLIITPDDAKGMTGEQRHRLASEIFLVKDIVNITFSLNESIREAGDSVAIELKGMARSSTEILMELLRKKGFEVFLYQHTLLILWKPDKETLERLKQK